MAFTQMNHLIIPTLQVFFLVFEHLLINVPLDHFKKTILYHLHMIISVIEREMYISFFGIRLPDYVHFEKVAVLDFYKLYLLRTDAFDLFVDEFAGLSRIQVF